MSQSDRSPSSADDDRTDLVLDGLARLREEVVSTRNVTIKADHLIKNLNAEVKVISARQSQAERKAILSSAVAYVLFVVLIFSGLWLTFQARLDKGRTDQALADRTEATFKQEIAELNAELGRWKQVERELLEFERLVREGKKEQAVAAYSALKRVRFAGLLEGLISRFKSEVAKEKYDHGVKMFKEGNFTKADEAFLKAREYHDNPPYLGRILYYQGMCALRLKDFPRAADLLRRALSEHLDRKLSTDASYHLAFAYDRMGEKRTARDLYWRFFNRHEKHPFARRAKRRYEQLHGNN